MAKNGEVALRLQPGGALGVRVTRLLTQVADDVIEAQFLMIGIAAFPKIGKQFMINNLTTSVEKLTMDEYPEIIR